MRNLFAALCLFLCMATVSGQTLLSRYSMAASFESVATVDANTWTVTLSFQADQTGNGYLSNQVQTNWRILTSTSRMYTITAVNSTTFSTANVTIDALPGTTQAPNGTAAVYEYDGTTDKIPLLPVNSTGVSAALAAKIHTHNVRVAEAAGSFSGSWDDLTEVPPGFQDGVDNEGTDDQTWAEVSGKPAGFADGIDDVNDADNVVGNEDNRLLLDGQDLVITKADGSTELNRVTIPASGSLASTARSVGDLQMRALFFPETQPYNIDLTGSAAAGYVVTHPGTNIQEFKWFFTGNSTTSNATGEFVVTLGGTQAAQFYRYNAQLYDLTNNTVVDMQATGNVVKQEVLSDGLRVTVPNIGGNYPNGFFLILN